MQLPSDPVKQLTFAVSLHYFNGMQDFVSDVQYFDIDLQSVSFTSGKLEQDLYLTHLPDGIHWQVSPVTVSTQAAYIVYLSHVVCYSVQVPLEETVQEDLKSLQAK